MKRKSAPADLSSAPAGRPVVTVVPIDDLSADPSNARVHGDENRRATRASVARFGSGRSIVLDGSNVVRAGNGTVDAARLEGFREVLVIEPRPNQLVAVRRPDWSESQAAAYAIADNRTAESATWHDVVLASTLDRLPENDRDATGFSQEYVTGLLERLASERAGSLSADLRESGNDGTSVDPLGSVAPAGGFPSLETADRHQVTLWYTSAEEDALKAFVGQTEPGPLHPNATGRRIIERIVEQFTSERAAGHSDE